MTDALINGHAGGAIDSADRGLSYGDGLFETISCRDGAPRWLALHLERLLHGCERLRIAFRDLELLRAEIRGLAAGQQRCHRQGDRHARHGDTSWLCSYRRRSAYANRHPARLAGRASARRCRL